MSYTSIDEFQAALPPEYRAICHALRDVIDAELPDAESKIWHRHPVWFLQGNPIVGYSRLKAGMRLMFWSGADFEEPELKSGTGKFKDASRLYADVEDVDIETVKKWLKKSRRIQWDYKNVYKRKGRLERIV
ncbi:DUF1801 domain-containing protein [Pseudaestuariivita sp.]|uniref:DUF1801 domain-containing protein n=1 Tax=Pseudaestuariivita sp. TaxID=2211669 RepID=UPI00405A0F7E